LGLTFIEEVRSYVETRKEVVYLFPVVN